MSATCAVLPDVDRSTASPGKKWSTPLPTESMGIRTGSGQLTPSVDVLRTRSLAEHFCSNRQSCQTTYTFPEASISADGSGMLSRIPPAAWWNWTGDTVFDAAQLAPPFVELKALTLKPARPRNPLKGTITVPFGCTSGWPPMPGALLPVASAAP